MSVAIDIDRDRIAEFCRTWRIVEFSLFGSVLRNDFRPDSDVDVMVVFGDEARIGMRELTAMEEALREIFGRDVDLITRKSVEQGRNWIRRRHILEHCERIL